MRQENKNVKHKPGLARPVRPFEDTRHIEREPVLSLLVLLSFLHPKSPEYSIEKMNKQYTYRLPHQTALCGPVLKLVIFSFSSPSSPPFADRGPAESERLPWLARRCGAGFPPTGQTSATTGSPSLTIATCVSPGMGRPEGEKNVSKYNRKACTFDRRSAVDTSLNEDEKSSCLLVMVPRWRSCWRTEVMHSQYHC
jgi:hypothetical protein